MIKTRISFIGQIQALTVKSTVIDRLTYIQGFQIGSNSSNYCSFRNSIFVTWNFHRDMTMTLHTCGKRCKIHQQDVVSINQISGQRDLLGNDKIVEDVVRMLLHCVIHWWYRLSVYAVMRYTCECCYSYNYYSNKCRIFNFILQWI